jgi:hypothetical protein
MNKKIGSLMVILLALLLLVYSAARSLDFIMLTLPEDKKIMAWFGLAALDGGLVCWVLAYMHGSKGGWQRAISLLMVGVDLLGSVTMFTLDTLYSSGQSGITATLTPDQMQNAVLALSGIIALNIAATVAHHLTDPDKMREQAEEEAFGKVEDATLKQISENANQLAADLAPVLSADWMTKTKARYTAHLQTALPAPIAPQIIDAVARDLPKKRRAGGLAQQLFKKPVRILKAETIKPGELVDVAASARPKPAKAESKRPVKPTTATARKSG